MLRAHGLQRILHHTTHHGGARSAILGRVLRVQVLHAALEDDLVFILRLVHRNIDLWPNLAVKCVGHF